MSNETGSEKSKRALSILVVDDEQEIVDVVIAGVETFNNHEWDVYSAGNGKEALAAVEAHKPCLVILDIVLPDMDGFEVCRRIKAICPSMPVISISGHSDEETIRNIRHAGASEFLEKPFSIIKLLKIVRNYISQENAS